MSHLGEIRRIRAERRVPLKEAARIYRAERAERAPSLPERLREASEEIADEGHNGWGNLCREAADELDRMKAHERQAFEAGVRKFWAYGCIYDEDMDVWFAAYLAKRKDH
jgi:hypothetical protein